MTLLVSQQLCELFCSYAKQLLVVFVENMKALYIREMIVYNVHGLFISHTMHVSLADGTTSHLSF